jgi:hypothetical protein
MMKIGFLTLLITATLLLTLAFPVAAVNPKAAPAAAATASPAPAAPAPMPPPLYSHPRVEHAIEAMRAARQSMANAEGEFHGHRDKAIEHLDKAIREAETCLNEP